MNRQEYESQLETWYEPVAVLSDSTEGRVLLLRHRNLGRNLVVRFSTRDLSIYYVLKRIEHPYLVHVYDALPLEDGFVELEEAVDGKTVDQCLKETGLFRYRSAKKVLFELCLGLSALHEIGIVHRDLKPQNVMISADGHCKLLDFDAARLALPTPDTIRLGTAGYAAPEQYVGSSDVGSDIYALGVLLNIMLTGVHPSERLPKQRRARKIVLKATQVHPDKRFASAEKFREAL